jgi:hypothetical protein
LGVAAVTGQGQAIRDALRWWAADVPEQRLRRDEILAALDELEKLAEWNQSGIGNDPVSERDSLIAQLQAAEARVAELEEALRRIVSAGRVKTGVSGYEEHATGDLRLEGLADIAAAALSPAQENETP